MPLWSQARHRPLLVVFIAFLTLIETQASGYSSGEKDQGEVIVLITDHRDAIDDFKELLITVSGARFHRSGARSDQGWVVITGGPHVIDLTRYKDGATFQLSRTSLFAGRYDAAELLATSAHGTVQNGESVDVPTDLQPARVSAKVRAGETTEITFDLVVQDFRDHPGKTWAVLIREVRVHQETDPPP